MKNIKIQSNSEEITATIFDSTDAKAVLIIASATGVKQTFYRKFAEYASEHQMIVITFDYHGIGQSLNKPIKTLINNVEDWGKHDLESVVNYALGTYPALKKFLIGHSIGGQLIGLSESSLQIDKIVLIAAQSGYWKLWDGTGRIKMWFNWYVLFPVLLNLFGFLPSKRISGMEDLPKEVAKQWSSWGKKNGYLLSEIPIDQTVYDKIEAGITAFSIDDDDYAPKKAVDWMSDKYSKADLTAIHLKPGDFNTNKIGHFGIFREKFKDTLWDLILKEMK